jgi:alpha-glucosidase
VFANFTAAELSAVVRRTLDTIPAGACPVWMASNHDVGRFPSRWCLDDDDRARLALLILATLPGTAVLYYGDEIGMLDVDVPLELQRDEMSLGGSGTHGNRDRARTPMQWDASPSGGFSPAPRPWLPLGDTSARNVAGQREEPGSTLRLCRDLLTLRRAELGGRIVPYELVAVIGGLWAYRVGDLIVAANLSDQPARWPFPLGEILLRTPGQPADAGTPLTLAPWQGLIARQPA